MPSRGSSPATAASSSSSQQEAMRRMKKIVVSFLARPDIAPFAEPVDWRGLELYDYPEIIKRQMDLGTIQRKLERNQYGSAGEVAYDIRQVWKNCMTYNAVGSDFWLLAKGYARRFEDRYRRIRNEYDVGEEPVGSSDEEEEEEEDSSDEEDEGEAGAGVEDDGEEEFEDTSTPSKQASDKTSKPRGAPKLDDRAKFASNLLLLSGSQLGHVIGMLESKCPAALENGSTLEVPEKMEIIIDKIEPANVFHSVAQYAADKVSKSNKRSFMATPKLQDVSKKRRRK